jgi:kanamycin kinase/aminoglycoside 3'-phosphotransferase-2
MKAAENSISYETLKTDKINYEWLSSKVPAPSILFYQQLNGHEFHCMSELEGSILASTIGIYSEEQIVKKFAHSLKRLHSLKIEKKALVRPMEEIIEQVKLRIANGSIELDSFEEENPGKSPNELFEELIENKPENFEPVFTHGDYCFDNLIVNGGQLNGFIDIGRGGVADKYQDIALALRSIRLALGEEWIDKFLYHYGLMNIDKKKNDFFTLL